MAGLTIEQQLAKVKEREAALNARLVQKEALKIKQAALKKIKDDKQAKADKANRVKIVGEWVLRLALEKPDVKKWLFDPIEGLGKDLGEEDRRLFPELPITGEQ